MLYLTQAGLLDVELGGDWQGKMDRPLRYIIYLD